MPNCSSDCNRIYGPSVACDLCGAIDVATIISNLSVSILRCRNTFTFLGYSLCLVSFLLFCVELDFIRVDFIRELIRQ